MCAILLRNLHTLGFHRRDRVAQIGGRPRSDGMYLVGPDGAILEVNQCYARMVGYSAAELLTMETVKIRGR